MSSTVHERSGTGRGRCGDTLWARDRRWWQELGAELRDIPRLCPEEGAARLLDQSRLFFSEDALKPRSTSGIALHRWKCRGRDSSAVATVNAKPTRNADPPPADASSHPCSHPGSHSPSTQGHGLQLCFLRHSPCPEPQPSASLLFAGVMPAAAVLLPRCWRQIAHVLPLARDPASQQPFVMCIRADAGGTGKGAGSLVLAELHPSWMLCSLRSTQKVQERV